MRRTPGGPPARTDPPEADDDPTTPADEASTTTRPRTGDIHRRTTMKKRSTLAMIAEDLITLAVVALVLLAMTGGLDQLLW